MIGAFFDIDGTLYRDSLVVEHFKKLIKFEVIDERVWLNNVEGSFVNWSRRSGDYERYLEDLADSYQVALKGLNANSIDFIAQKVIENTWEKTYKYTRYRVEKHLELGHKVIFISGSPDFLVSKMAKKYNVTDFSSTKYILDDNGSFTGELIPMWDSKSKDREIKKYIKKYNIDMSKSYSYGDTLGDYSMLISTGNPVAINPNKKLIQKISENPELSKKIKVVVERKDMVYQIDINKNVENL